MENRTTGGRIMTDLLPWLRTGTAVISPCGLYRYRLTREISSALKSCLFIMLNPSTADASEDDPTIRRCIGFAKAWECGTLVVVNLFAFRATSPKDMMASCDPVGPENHTHVVDAADSVARQNEAFGPEHAGPIICAWGVGGSYLDQGQTVRGWLEREGLLPLHLGVTKAGHPKHPLYLPKDTEPQPFKGA
jgi:hypothetical protein